MAPNFPLPMGNAFSQTPPAGLSNHSFSPESRCAITADTLPKESSIMQHNFLILSIQSTFIFSFFNYRFNLLLFYSGLEVFDPITKTILRYYFDTRLHFDHRFYYS